jgi:FtsP/CotA-like multicopper oxidase with cupredoxin domain
MSYFDKQPASRQSIVQNVAIGAASTQLANPFSSETYQVRLAATAACYYLITERAHAVAVTTSSGSYLPANVVEFVAVTPGQTLTVIEATTAGTLSVTELH